LDFPISSIYPPVEFPVSSGTSLISPLIRWDHSEDWFVTKYDAQTGNPRNERKLIVTLSDKKYEYLSGHIIDGNYGRAC
jgi:fatty acid synthase, animal type